MTLWWHGLLPATVTVDVSDNYSLLLSMQYYYQMVLIDGIFCFQVYSFDFFILFSFLLHSGAVHHSVPQICWLIGFVLLPPP